MIISKIENRLELPVYGGETHEIASFEFINQSNEVVKSEDLEGKIWLVNYFFASCPSVCPRMTRNMQAIHDIVRQDDEIQFLSFTADPKRDTPERLMKFSEAYNVDHKHWYFLTGDKKELYRAARKSFLLSASEGGGGENDFIHSQNIVLIDQKGKIRGFYDGLDKENMSQCLEDIKKLK